jgi:hypothetical protein
MFSVAQETENGQKLWPGISCVFTSEGLPGTYTVTALLAAGGSLDFRPSRKRMKVYVMNENGATVARYDLGNNPNVAEPERPEGIAE